MIWKCCVSVCWESIRETMFVVAVLYIRGSFFAVKCDDNIYHECLLLDCVCATSQARYASQPPSFSPEWARD